MSAVMALALKDLRLLIRVKSALFFSLVWPLLVAVFFGLLFGGQGGRAAPLPIAIVDEDASPDSRAFVDGLATRNGFDVARVARREAADLVRRGRRVAAVVLPPGFGAASQRLFYGTPPKVEVLIDPSREAETAMLQGLIFEQAAQRLQTAFTNPVRGRALVDDALRDLKGAPADAVPARDALERMLGSLGTYLGAQPAPAAPSAAAPAWTPVSIDVTSVARERTGPQSGFEVTFPQGILWGILGSMMSFAVSIAVERSQGTLTRLRMSPTPGWALLAGKALACYVLILTVEALLVTIGVAGLGLRIASPGLFLVAALIAPLAFVGIMMLVASLGSNEQAAAGAGWAIMMPLAMLGGAMIPLIVMPAWMVSASHASPVKWAILAYEGAIWRGFSAQEMVLPCVVLLATGALAFAIGARRFSAVSA